MEFNYQQPCILLDRFTPDLQQLTIIAVLKMTVVRMRVSRAVHGIHNNSKIPSVPTNENDLTIRSHCLH